MTSDPNNEEAGFDHECEADERDIAQDFEHEIERDSEHGINFRSLICEVMALTIPKKRLKQAKTISIDQTAFPSFYRGSEPHHFLVQKEVDQAVREATRQGKGMPEGYEFGPDGKLIRSADKDARGGRRSASAGSGHRSGTFDGYWVSIGTLNRDAAWSGKPNKKCRLGPPVPPYVIAFSVDPATVHVGSISAQLALDAFSIAPNLKEVIADRGITQYGQEFVRPLHEAGLNVTMDHKTYAARVKLIEAGAGKQRQRLFTVYGDFYPLWLPYYFQVMPEGLSAEEQKEWHENRAKFRFSRMQKFLNGDSQFGCPQCAGRVVSNLETHNKHVKVSKSAVSLRIRHPGDDDPSAEYDGESPTSKCCEGRVTIPVDMLDLWQPLPWGTRAWKKSYRRRLQVENVNSMLKHDSRMDYRFCRARGLGAHIIAVLALVIMYNLRLQETDPLADNDDDEDGDDNSGGSTPTAADRNADGISESELGNDAANGSDKGDGDDHATGDGSLRSPP